MGSFDDEVQELVTYYGTLAGKHTAHRAFEEAAKTIVLERREARGQKAAREQAEEQVKKLLNGPDGLMEFVKASNALRDELKISETQIHELETALKIAFKGWVENVVRVQKLEAVAEAAKQLCAAIYDAYIMVPSPKGGCENKQVPVVLPDLLKRLKETLAALEDDSDTAMDNSATCRVCGCTEDEPCAGGCYWVEDPEGLGDLCSKCLFELYEKFAAAVHIEDGYCEEERERVKRKLLAALKGEKGAGV